MADVIYRQEAIDALWKALFEYEDKTEKQFLESDELDIRDWMQHRIFVQNMSDIDRETILNLPSAQPEAVEVVRCKDCKYYNPIGVCIEMSSAVCEDSFCCWAERRTNATD